jgi:hypothetical protein
MKQISDEFIIIIIIIIVLRLELYFIVFTKRLSFTCAIVLEVYKDNNIIRYVYKHSFEVEASD